MLGAGGRCSRRPMAVGLRLNPPFVNVDESLDLDDLWTAKKASKGTQSEMSLSEFVETFIDGQCTRGEVVARARGHKVAKNVAERHCGEALRLGICEEVKRVMPRGRPKMVVRKVAPSIDAG